MRGLLVVGLLGLVACEGNGYTNAQALEKDMPTNDASLQRIAAAQPEAATANVIVYEASMQQDDIDSNNVDGLANVPIETDAGSLTRLDSGIIQLDAEAPTVDGSPATTPPTIKVTTCTLYKDTTTKTCPRVRPIVYAACKEKPFVDCTASTEPYAHSAVWCCSEACAYTWKCRTSMGDCCNGMGQMFPGYACATPVVVSPIPTGCFTVDSFNTVCCNGLGNYNP